jgi:hypothetical protein
MAARAHTKYETFADADLEGMLRDNLTTERADDLIDLLGA